jgi:branched-chain amino acid transport system permease protein
MRNINRWGAAFFLVIALAGPFIWTNDSTITILIQTLLLATLASSWNILGGIAGQINLGHAAFFGLGALTTRLLWLEYEWPFILSFAAAGLVAVVFAAIIGAPGLRLRGIYFSIGTLAIGEAVRITVGNLLPVVTRFPGPQLVSYDLTPRYYLILGVLLATLLISYYLQKSRLGLGMLTVREDEDAARAIGVNVFFSKMTALLISAFFAGLAGGAFAFYHVSYYFNLPFHPIRTFDAIIVAFIGGIGTLAGPVVGSFFFILVRDVIASTWVDFHLIIFGVLFIVVVLIFPGGFVEFWQRLIRFRKPKLT